MGSVAHHSAFQQWNRDQQCNSVPCNQSSLQHGLKGETEVVYLQFLQELAEALIFIEWGDCGIKESREPVNIYFDLK